MVFSDEPQFDIPSVKHLLVFYKETNYSLNTLRHFCFREKFIITEDFIIVMLDKLLHILIKFYEKNYYGLNINMDTVLYLIDENTFKINCFNYIKNLNGFYPVSFNPQYDGKKGKHFVKCFIQDESAISNIII
jgi:hypothetical protein